MIKLKLLIVATTIFPMVLCAQTNIPAGIDGNKYTYCMNELQNANGLTYAVVQDFCQNWAAHAVYNPYSLAYGMPDFDLPSHLSDSHFNEMMLLEEMRQRASW